MTSNICKVIAEVGSTWLRSTPEASRQAALDSIRVAKECGADIVKFQMLTADGPWSKERALDKWEATRPYWLPPEWLPSLRTLAASVGIEFWLSFFDIASINEYSGWCDGLKLASGELTETSKPLLIAMAKQAEKLCIPMAVSTGTHTEAEVAQAMDWLSVYDKVDLIIMNCASKYPADYHDYKFGWTRKYIVNGIKVGVSDHTMGIGIIVDAVSNFTSYFEKHFKLSDTQKDNPDFNHSLSPGAFKKYIDAIRASERTWYRIDKKLAPGEESERVWMQRGTDGKRPRDA